MEIDIIIVLIVICCIVLFIYLVKYIKLIKSNSYIGMKYIKKNKIAKAVKYLKKAAGEGDPVCAYNLGVIYLKGEAVLFNKMDVVKYFKLAHDNAGKGDFKVHEYMKKIDKREVQNKKIKSIVKKLWREEELWTFEGDASIVLNY